MYLLMCRDCGKFVVAIKKNDNLEPVPSCCPNCDGVDFTAVQEGEDE